MPDSILDRLKAAARAINLKQAKYVENPTHPEYSNKVVEAENKVTEAARSPLAQVISGPSKVYWKVGTQVGKAALEPVQDYLVKKTGLQDTVAQQKADWAAEEEKAKQNQLDPVDGGEIDSAGPDMAEMAKRQEEWRLRQAIRSRLGQ